MLHTEQWLASLHHNTKKPSVDIRASIPTHTFTYARYKTRQFELNENKTCRKAFDPPSRTPPTHSPLSLRVHSAAPPFLLPTITASQPARTFPDAHPPPSPSSPSLRRVPLALAQRYLALRLKIIAVSPGRRRCYCASAAESPEHLERRSAAAAPPPGTEQAVDASVRPLHGSRVRL